MSSVMVALLPYVLGSFFCIGLFLHYAQPSPLTPSLAGAGCDSFRNPATCDASPNCVWCVSFAIPSKCYSLKDAANLPSGVFTCDAKTHALTESVPPQQVQVNFPSLKEHFMAESRLCDSKVKQISGYFQIGDADQHYFFWFFESRSNPEKDPLVMWLTGGPGCSSELALFAENGPCSINDKLETVNNAFSWNSKANLLYVDQPGGTGFSYGSDKTAASEEKAVAEDLYLFLQAFLTKYTKFQNNKFFLFGESYAGHYVPATAHRIWLGNKNKEFSLRIALSGVSVGNGMTNPQLQFPWFPLMAYNSSFAPSVISSKQFAVMSRSVPVCQELIALCNFLGGSSCVTALEYCEMNLIAPIQALGYNQYDLRLKCAKKPLCYDFSSIGKYLNQIEVRHQLGVPDFVGPWEECSNKVNARFSKDWMRNFAERIPALLEDGIPVLIYAGDQDYICNWLGNKNWVTALKWSKHDEFKAKPDVDWNKNKGLVRRVGPLSFLQVYQAGHMVPMDQPQVALDMLNQFMSKQGPWK